MIFYHYISYGATRNGNYNVLQEREGSNIKFVHGIPDDEDEIVSDTSAPHLVIFDDMLGDKDEEKNKLWFTRKGHYRNATVVYIIQMYFSKVKHLAQLV